MLISPIAVQRIEREGRRLYVALTRKQVKNSPDIDTDKPVSRQHEIQYFGYYGYPYYWGRSGMWNAGIYSGGFGLPGGESGEIQARAESERAERAIHEDEDPHLRSCEAVVGYHVEATDGAVGHVDGLLINEKTWAIQYLVINTSNWGLGHRVLIAPEWIDGVHWHDKTVSVDLDSESIKTSPAYESSQALNRELEERLYNHYGRGGYWVTETVIVDVER